MTMIRLVTTVLTTPLFAGAGRSPALAVTRWTERRRLPPPVPAWDDDIIEIIELA